MSSKNKIVALVISAIGLVLVLLSIYFLKDEIREQYYLWSLRSGDETARRDAAQWLGRNKSEKAVSTLLEIFRRDPTLPEHWNYLNFPYAVKALVRIGAPAIPALIEATKARSKKVRVIAVLALGKVNHRTEERVSALMEALTDSSEDVRGRSAYSLGQIGAEAVSAAPLLIDNLCTPDGAVYNMPTDALVSIGQLAVPPLIRAFRHKNPDVRDAVVWVLIKIGEPAEPALTEAASSEDADIQRRARKALERIQKTR